jgi:hypothetical protein
VVEGARLESVCRGNSTEGSNPSLSASFHWLPSVTVLAPGLPTLAVLPPAERLDFSSPSRQNGQEY